MTAIDTSVAVAAMTAEHVDHRAARRAAAGAMISAHARLETYSVLTRLPPPHRLAAEVAAELIAGWFPSRSVLMPTSRLSRGIVERAVRLGIAGGAVYDALVAMTAAENGHELLTRDERAASTYERVGVGFTVI